MPPTTCGADLERLVPHHGMVVAPCSIRSMSEIATGVTSTLLTRAADVVLKERRRLVLMVRETPLHTGHLRTMLALSEMGAIIAPPVPAFYAGAQTLDDMVDQTWGASSICSTLTCGSCSGGASAVINADGRRGAKMSSRSKAKQQTRQHRS